MTTVYFATNRKKDGTGDFGFGATSISTTAPADYAVAEVHDVTLDDADAGKIASIHDTNPGDFSQAIKSQIIGPGRNLLVFIHGADNSFEDAIKRAAFNREWFAASQKSAANTSVVAFTWPSSDDFITLTQTPLDAYRADQTQAGKANVHLAQFLKNIDRLRDTFLAMHAGGKIFLLAHSMGNYALQAAVQGGFDEHAPNDLIFDQVFLAAPDEVPDTFERPHGGRLANLPKLCDRISVYYSRRDLLMLLSHAANGGDRLGFNGPTAKNDPKRYPEQKFRLLDCSDVLDYLPVGESSHQYYRKSKIVRADIVSAMVDVPRPDGGNIVFSMPPGGVDPGAIV
jgi:esterase/lipase superfamily enzyme